MSLILNKVLTKPVVHAWLRKRTGVFLSCFGTDNQLHCGKGNVTYRNVMTGKVDKFGGITVHLNERDFTPDVSERTFNFQLRGAVLDEAGRKVLVVQDKNKTKNAWKFPGGLSDPGENIGDTAVREVLEETGVHAEFQSLLSIRQQHDHPGAFGISDMYLICRLRPLTFQIDFCTQECLRCEWLPLEELAHTYATTPITSRVARLLLYGLQHGFYNIDLPMEQLPAVYSGMFYQLYHRALPVTAG